ncbi:MAG: response regulator transcription factor [Bacillota bacterium]|jgi:DNA-binding NarL/FixJ family response regulator|nr:response regulator transcription factor [Bacillota bacterium]MDP4154527.1 response regulator transcription factor [Bacillota bacterium]
MDKVKILIADAHYMFIRGIESILSDDETLEIVGKAQNGYDAYELTKQYKPDVLLMDVNLQNIDGLEVLRKISENMPEVKVLLLTIEEIEDQLFEALRLGAKGYLLKNLLPNELLTFIHMVNRGESIISGPIVRKIVEFITSHQPAELKSVRTLKKTNILTKREKEILMHVIKGYTNREIAISLCISENTVKNHLRNIMEKLQMNNRVQAATYALQEGWLQNI